MTTYAKHVSRRTTPQTEALPGQVANSAGGFSFAVDKWTKLDRFLILGAEGGTYYIGERKLTRECAQSVLDCASENAVRTVARIVEISESGRAIKNDPAIFALALLASQTNDSNRYRELPATLALEALHKVCRTGTHLFQFVESVNELRGWGRALRRAIADWYLKKTPDALALQVTKYQQRNGWSHRDLLRKSHPKTTTRAYNDIFQYVTQPKKWLESKRAGHRLLVTVEEAKTASITKVRKWIKEEGLVREHIPTEFLNDPGVWAALLKDMPLTALIRNLGKMTSIGLLKPLSKEVDYVVHRLRDLDGLKKARIHPFQVLLALKTYANGSGFRGSLNWRPVPEIIVALEVAFYLAFDFVQPTGKRYLLGIDVSGSMSDQINDTNVSCCEAAACLAMVTMRTEPRAYAFGFANQFVDLGITATDSIQVAASKAHNRNFGSTDAAVAINYARQHKLEVDTFIILTDNETYAGRIHPSEALKQYRRETGIPAKLVVVGMTANKFTIADPNDNGMLDVVGFDANAPQAIAEFSRT